jgi:dCTP deaminase
VVLSNVEIVNAIARGAFTIQDLAGLDPSTAPFNTSAVDLRIGNEINVLSTENAPIALDLRKPGVAQFWGKHSTKLRLSDDQPFTLVPNKFILANTYEKVDFPILEGSPVYSARIEGKSSLARCGLLIHFTAPTIHAGYFGPITLEIINLGPANFLLYPRMYVCQLIIEEVSGCPTDAPNQFKGQVNPVGEIRKRRKKR